MTLSAVEQTDNPGYPRPLTDQHQINTGFADATLPDKQIKELW